MDTQTRLIVHPRGTRVAPITVTSPVVRRRLWSHFLVSNVGAAVGFLVALGWLATVGFTALDWALFAVMHFVTLAGIELGFHRRFAHEAFKTGPITDFILAVLGMTVGQGPLAYWVANHRRHHAFSDREEDPHSPARGFLRSHLFWVLDPRITNTMRFAPDILAKPHLRFADRYYFVWLLAGVLAPGAFAWIVTGVPLEAVGGALAGGAFRLFVVQQGIFAVNSCGHVFGARPFETRDRSGNLQFISLFTLGGSLHNNHHAFPWSARTDVLSGEIDLGGLVIRLLALLRVARDVRVPEEASVREKLAPFNRPRRISGYIAKSRSAEAAPNG